MSKKIDNFLSIFEKDSSKELNKYALKKFFSIIKTKPEEFIKLDTKTIKQKILIFRNNIKHLEGTTIRNYLNSVEQFLIWEEIEINNFFKKLHKTGKSIIPRTKDRIPTEQELKEILKHCDLLEKTIILIALSSGTRIGTILLLEERDIDLNSNPTKIFRRREITKNKRDSHTFITPEATSHLKTWLKYRPTYQKISSTKCNNPNTKIKPINRKTIFPITYEGFRKRFMKKLELVDLKIRDKRTIRHTIHIHTLKKFFRTKSRIEEDYRNYFLEHNKYLDPEYFNPSIEDLKKEYTKGIQNLTIIDKEYISYEIEDLKEQLEEKTEDFETLWKTVNLMRNALAQKGIYIVEPDRFNKRYENEHIQHYKKLARKGDKKAIEHLRNINIHEY